MSRPAIPVAVVVAAALSIPGDRHPILVHFGTESRSAVPGGGNGHLPFFGSFSFFVFMASRKR
jgi:hypothetical protein